MFTRYLLTIPVLLIIIPGCKKTHCDKNGPLTTVTIFTNDTTKYQTAILARYKHTSNFTKPIDFECLTFINRVGNGVTTSQLYYLYFSSDYDYVITMYPTNEVLKVTDIHYGLQKNTETKEGVCQNETAFKVNGKECYGYDGFQLYR